LYQRAHDGHRVLPLHVTARGLARALRGGHALDVGDRAVRERLAAARAEREGLEAQSLSATQSWTEASAFGRDLESVPPACAMSGRPPPLPPTCEATKFTSPPAFTLDITSWVTPAMSLTVSPPTLAST